MDRCSAKKSSQRQLAKTHQSVSDNTGNASVIYEFVWGTVVEI